MEGQSAALLKNKDLRLMLSFLLRTEQHSCGKSYTRENRKPQCLHAGDAMPVG